jgi:DNA-directed RNA polymerase specialized sigma24 family protein
MVIGQEQHSSERRSSDQELVAAAVAGDASAWDALVDRHAQPMWTTVLNHGLDPYRASEVCAATWLRCADHLDELSGNGEIADWLLAAASRECLWDLRGTQRPVALLIQPNPHPAAGPTTAWATS